MFSDKSRFLRYLAAKTSVDDRALSERVWRALRAEALHLRKSVPAEHPFHIVELGAGIGSGILRLAERDSLLASLLPCTITLVDRDEAALETAKKRIQARLPGLRSLRLVVGDVLDFAVQAKEQGRAHLVVAQALLDMVELEETFDALSRLSVPQGLGYFPICFDGLSVFDPPDPLDAIIIEAFHASMEPTKPEPGSERHRTGRRLLRLLTNQTNWPSERTEMIAVGSSDWIVHPHEGAYPEDEAFFLDAILELLEVALERDGSIPSSDLNTWLDTRRDQLSTHKLIYLAHQLDFLVRYQASKGPPDS